MCGTWKGPLRTGRACSIRSRMPRTMRGSSPCAAGSSTSTVMSRMKLLPVDALSRPASICGQPQQFRPLVAASLNTSALKMQQPCTLARSDESNDAKLPTNPPIVLAAIPLPHEDSLGSRASPHQSNTALGRSLSTRCLLVDP